MLKENWSKTTVLVTGGTGSFGRKFIEIMLHDFHPEKLIVFSRDEAKQHEMYTGAFGHKSLRYFIGDVRDQGRLRRAMEGVDVVVHAAALKQVPSCEYNPIEAVLTNIIGTRNVIDVALDAGVRKVMTLSTDKAVNPVNLYGATKLVAEKLAIQANSYRGEKSTRFSCVRYGNVIASRGSVIPIFLVESQNGKVTVTDRRMTRFWITLEQGARLVIRCLELMHGGETFVPKLPTMRIMDLAKAIAPNCRVEFIGIRPGEKLSEVLISDDEARHTVEFSDMYIIKPVQPWWKMENWAQAKPLPEGFLYTSDKNKSLLSIKDLKHLIRPVH
jgi:UDP-N-acetylglucosamine 4,6-dehydratase